MPTPDGDHEIGIVRAHLEEDAAKTTHVGGRTGRIGGADYSLVDFNRGRPPVEIVTGPDVHSSEDARRFLQLLRQTIVELGISDAEMEKGTLRVDANVSVRPAGLVRAAHALRAEEHELLPLRRAGDRRRGRAGRRLRVRRRGRQETYDFDAATGTLTPRRAKEEARRLPLLPRADLVPVEPPAELIERLRDDFPESPARDPPDRGRSSTSTAPSYSSPAGSTASGEGTVAGADRLAPRT